VWRATEIEVKKDRVEIVLNATKTAAVVVNVDNPLPHLDGLGEAVSQAIEAMA
jgi:hypothetical protein